MPRPSHRWSDLVAELSQRRVFRTALAYAAVAWLALQFAVTMVEVLELPAWAPKLVLVLLVIGFPVATGLAWAYDITPGGVRRADGRPDARLPTRPLFVRLRAPLVVVAAVVFGGALAVWRRDAAPADASPTAVAVLPCTVRGGDDVAYLSDGMVSLLAANLDGAGELWSIDPKSVLVATGGNWRGAEHEARAVAARLGAGYYVTCEVVQAGSQLRMTARLQTVAGGTGAVRASADGSTAEPLSVIDRVTAELLAGRSAGHQGGLAEVTTESLSALKSYLRGQKALVSLDFPSALESFRQAVAEDSTFARAHLGAAWAGWWLGLDPEAGVSAAIRHSAGLSERERRLLIAHRHFVRGDREAERLYREILTAYPNDLDALYPLGELLVHYSYRAGRSYVPAARDVLDRVLRYQPTHGEALFHRVHLAAHARELETLDTLSTRLLALPHASTAEVALTRALRAFMLDDSAAVRDRALLLDELRTADDFSLAVTALGLSAMAGERDQARAVLRYLLQSSRHPRTQAAGRILLAQLDLAEGRVSRAMAALAAAEHLDPATVLMFRASFALMPFRTLPTAEGDALRRELEQWDAVNAAEPAGTLPSFVWLPGSAYTPARSYYLGLLDAQGGRDDRVSRHAATLDALADSDGALPRDLAHGVRAELARARGRTAAALTQLERLDYAVTSAQLTATPLHTRTRERFLRAQLLIEAGRDDEALGWLESIEQTLSLFDDAYIGPVLLHKAGILERRGEAAAAAAHYTRFAELWQHCDVELRPLVDEAVRRLQKLAADTRMD